MKKLEQWFKSDRTYGVGLVAVVLFLSSVACDQVMRWRGIVGAGTFVNDLVVAAAGGFGVWFLLRLQAERESLARARERLLLTAELNHHVRNAVTMMANSLLLRDPDERLRVMDEAVHRIDRVLTELVPTAGLDREPRLFLRDAD
jgi:hypothetical protein